MMSVARRTTRFGAGHDAAYEGRSELGLGLAPRLAHIVGLFVPGPRGEVHEISGPPLVDDSGHRNAEPSAVRSHGCPQRIPGELPDGPAGVGSPTYLDGKR